MINSGFAAGRVRRGAGREFLLDTAALGGSEGLSELRLHLGGMEPKPGWTIVNIQPGPGVDIVADITDLSAIPAASAAEV